MADANTVAAEQPAPPPTQRRPRVREVSSRFMSPLVHSNSTPIPTTNTSDLPRSKSVHRRLLPKTDENHAPETNRAADKSSAPISSTVQRKHHPQQRSKHLAESRDPPPRVSSRPDTPITTGTDRIVPSRYRQAVPGTIARSNSLSSSSNGLTAVTAAARLLQEATADVDKSTNLPRILTSSRDDMDCGRRTSSSSQGTSSCPNSPLLSATKLRSISDARSSMPEVDKWLAERNSNGRSEFAARSMNFSSSTKTGGGIALPPHPSSLVRSGLDSKKGRKASNQQEDLHSLKMLQNHYLLWRHANSKAKASARAQRQEAERKFYSIGSKLSELRDNVKRKRRELETLSRIKALNMIVGAQMPCLDQWANFEEDYSASLLATTDALISSSIRLPVSGEVRVDVGELQEAMSSALKVAELISNNIQRFISKAEDIDTTVSELAKTAGGERALVEECGDVLSKTRMLQVKECSLRGTVMQLQLGCSDRQSTIKAKD
ncbi:protein ENDOSPERM DEFECTIVE 1-like [Andrographis paniculata]|uniref:protein ENDOSPERM DEFECTIVE 1-like n=1 Tax=Andrographis paniculata TaxID=175694 RepID=UPI0021E94523|nr:protein ENDOSPERM DEFECTIVE 1-like [Andrographis paniculata]